MEINVHDLKIHLDKSRSIINKGYTSAKTAGIDWLNSFCAEFLEFTNLLHQLIANQLSKNANDGNNHLDAIFLCLSQILVCVRHLEITIKAESDTAISASRQHFLDRIHWCLERLRDILNNIVACPNGKLHMQLEEHTFVELMDAVLDGLVSFSAYEACDNEVNVAKKNAETMFASKEIRAAVDLILGHTLAFANVALKQDKKALSALCQKVLRECILFQNECALNQQQAKLNNCNRKLFAMSLENALYQLEDYINEALLRLVYICFLDFNKFSIEKLRTVMRLCDQDDPGLDELIADFDVNVDRTTQIGIFAIAFAPNAKVKTSVRSCLASFESLDACIIPSLQTKNSADIHSEILEQHFNEEVAKFKLAMQEIIDSYAFTKCYHEILSDGITQAQKHFDKVQLQELVQMGEFLCEHFRLRVNANALREQADRLQLYEKFTLMLHECQAILMCADQVETQRIIKRFKILRSVLHKFMESLNDAKATGRGAKCNSNDIFLLSDELSDSQRMFASNGISPSVCSILYCSESSLQRRAPSDSLKGNYSKLSNVSQLLVGALQKRLQTTSKPVAVNSIQERRCSVRRKESLRTAMFKRQKSTETEKIYEIYKNNSASLQISEILDQLTSLSSTFSNASQTT